MGHVYSWYHAAIKSYAYCDLCALWDVIATNFNSTRARTPGNAKDWWVHAESFKENLKIKQQMKL